MLPLSNNHKNHSELFFELSHKYSDATIQAYPWDIPHIALDIK